MLFSDLNGRPDCSPVPLLEALRRPPDHTSSPELTPFKLLRTDDGRPHQWIPGENNSHVHGDLVAQVRPEEAGIVLFVFGIWLAAIALFFNRWLF